MPNKRFNKQVPAFKAGGRAGKMGGGMMMQKPMMKKGGDVKKIEKTFKPKKNLKKVKDKLDPRLYNGAILIGLNSPVVKSHGSTDYIGFSNSLDVCNRIVKGNLIEKIKHNI